MTPPESLLLREQNLGEGTFLVLGILHEAVASFSRQRTLPDLWQSVCRNARWIVPCHRMAVLLSAGPDRCNVAARIESGQICDPFASDFAVSDQFLRSILRARGAQWFTELDQPLQGRDELHDFLLKDQPAALIAVPLHSEQKQVGALVFVLKNHNPADQQLLNALVIGYSLYVGMTYSMLNTMTELQAVREQQDLLMAEIEAKNLELEQRNIDIEAKNVALESQNAELERFTYTVSHDLKAPLVTISGFLGLLQKDIEAQDGEAIAGDLKQISGATDRMAQLLNELLELSRIGRLMNTPEQIHLSELAQEVLNRVELQLDHFDIEVDVAPNMPSVYGDPGRLYEVFQNLIDNAIKFMGERAAPRIEVGGYTDAGEIVCFVRDNGIGIHADYQQRVFELFDRLDLRIDGTGIGLALVKRIVEVHGGRIWVESEGEGHGSTFWFTFPAAESHSV